MRNGILAVAAGLAVLGTTEAHAGEPAFEVGAHAGVFVFDELDVINTSWYATPRLGYWFDEGIGLELDVGISTGAADAPGHGFLAVQPKLNVVGDPIPLSKNSPVRPIITAGGGFIYKSIDGAGVQGESYATERIEGLGTFGAGLVVPIVGPLQFRTDVRVLIMGAPEVAPFNQPFLGLEATAGLEARFGLAKDADKDKIPDKIDLCPDEPEDKDDFEDEDGCPESDNDVDGVPDVDDGCPNEAEDLDGFADADGCPELDNDEDGLLDDVDRCPVDAGTEATGGCPDADGDLVPDLDDRCPEKAGLAEFEGCPDTDGDGLPDPDDECPEEVGPIESFGCPDGDTDLVPTYRDDCPDEPANEGIDPLRSDGCPSKVFVTKDAIRITEDIKFASGSDRIYSSSHGLMDGIAELMAKYPEIRKVQVEGHTDSRGNDDFNMELSQKRAAAVVKYLVESGGIEAERLVAKGFGETKPIADNGTSAGRAENRRVEFNILEQGAIVEEVTAEEAETMEGEVSEEPPAETMDEAPAEEAPAEEAPADAPVEEAAAE